MLEPESDLWAQVRYAYEHTDQPIGDICIEHGISTTTLRDRMRRWQWKRRRPPIPRVGPPAITPPPPTPLRLADASRSDPPRRFAGGGMEPAALPVLSCATGDLTPPVFAGAQTIDPPAPGEGEDPDAIVPRLRGAVARVLPAIEATIARLAAGSQHPREMEQAGRALSALTRTLRELNALLAEHNARAGGLPAEDMPEDIDAFREALATRIDLYFASRTDEDDEEATGEEI
jgi:hypothetical protein